MKRLRFLFLVCAAFWIATTSGLAAPAVQVTLKLDANQIAVGESTTLHVFAQIVEAQRAGTDRIFSWYVDLLNSSAAVAKLNADNLVRTASDKDPRTSSAGSAEGANRRGIYDTFLNLAGAGKDAPVELFSIPVQGLAAGTASFHLQAGTGVAGLATDFIVAPTGGGDPLLGGDYSAASIQLKVTGGGTVCEARISKIAHSAQAGGANQAVITFAPCPGRNLSVEFSDDVGSGLWQALPGAPHNSGSVTDSSTSSRRFYRLRVGD